MAKKGTLFYLVKSLSRSEKRYFKLFAATNKDSNYLKLFNVIENQLEIDDEVIKDQFKGQPFLNQLHVTKIYLAELILKSLRNYYANDTVHAQLLDLLRDIEILFRKELYDTCGHKIEKAERLATRYEKGALLLEVLTWKRKLMMAISGSDQNEIMQVLSSEKKVLHQLVHLNQYWNSTFTIFELINGKSFLKSLDLKNATTLQALTLHHHLVYTYYFVNGKLSKAEHQISKLISYLEKHPLRIEDDPSPYVTALGNKISMLLTQKRWKEIETLIGRMRNVPIAYKLKAESKFTVRLWLRIFNLELEVYRDTRQLALGLQLIHEVEEYLKIHEHAVPATYKIMLFYQMAGIYFLTGDFQKALQWINKIINTNFGKIRPDLQIYARFLNLVIHFELNNIIVLRYSVDSCRRFLKKTRTMFAFEQQVLLLFSRLSLARPDEYKPIFQKSYSDIYTKNSAAPERIQDYIDLKGWINDKKSGKQLN